MNQVLSPVLAAEDEESDRLILAMAFRKARLQNPLQIFRDGQELIEHLLTRGSGNGGAPPAPALILLDLKMPRMDGFDVLAWLRSQPAWAHVPALVLSSSSDESDVRRARQLGALEYCVKPHNYEDLVKLAERICAFYLSVQTRGPGIGDGERPAISMASSNRPVEG